MRRRNETLVGPVTAPYRRRVCSWRLDYDDYGAELNKDQHYEFVPFFHGDERVFADQLRRDEDKRRLSEEARVRLVEIDNREFGARNVAELEAHIFSIVIAFGIECVDVDRDEDES